MHGKGLNQRTVSRAVTIFVVLAAIFLILGSRRNLFGTAADTPSPVAYASTPTLVAEALTGTAQARLSTFVAQTLMAAYASTPTQLALEPPTVTSPPKTSTSSPTSLEPTPRSKPTLSNLARTAQYESQLYPAKRSLGQPSGIMSAPAEVVVAARPFEFIDRSGEVRGRGRITVYAAQEIGVDEEAEIRVEIEVLVASSREGIQLSSTPEPSVTPLITTPRPLPSPLPMVDSQYIEEVRQYMGVDLRGAGLAENFDIQAVPRSGIRENHIGAVSWWRWNLRPLGEASVGKYHVEVVAYLPGETITGEEHREETNNVVGFELVVRSSSVDTLRQFAPAIFAILIAFAVWITYYRLRNGNIRTAFASYQRASSSLLVQTIAEKSKKLRVRVLFDTSETASAGQFPDRIGRMIKDSEVFICLLGEATLESLWVRREIELAHSLHKPMIPVFQERFRTPSPPLPDYIASLLEFDGVTIFDVQNIMIDESIRNLAEMIRKTPRKMST